MTGRKENQNSNRKGTATVEAAIILPLVMLAILSVLSIVRIAGTYERIQHALNQVAEDLSQYSYLYAISGLKGKHDTLADNIDKSQKDLLEQQNTVSAFYESIRSIAGDAAGLGQTDDNTINTLIDTINDMDNVESSWKELNELVGKILEDPVAELRLVSLALSDTLFSDAKTMLIGSISKAMLEARLSNELRVNARDLEARLRLGTEISDLDFSCSTFFDDKETIDLIVEYTVKPMPDFIFLPEIRLRNRACVLAWTWGVGREAEPSKKNDNESIWNLDENKNYTKQHFSRGNKAESLYTEELLGKLGSHAKATPYHFKTVDVIEYAHNNKDGSLITVFSMNPFLPTYKKDSAVSGEINRKLSELKNFTRYKCGDFLIDVDLLEGNPKRIVYVVIPENNELPEVYLTGYQKAAEKARSLGIELIQVKKYGEYDKGSQKEDNAAEQEKSKTAAEP